MTEKAFELKLKKEVEKFGGLCLKLQTPGFTGIPDRLVLLPGGKVWFVEVKKPKSGSLSIRQNYVLDQLSGLDHNAVKIDSLEQLDKLLQDIKNTVEFAARQKKCIKRMAEIDRKMKGNDL